MRIALINGSPKTNGSVSAAILQDVRPLLEAENRVIDAYHLNGPAIRAEEIANLSQCDILIFAFPLYVDGIPAHLLQCLLQLEESLVTSKKEITAYAVVNCGFYEGRQNSLAIAMIENWCHRAGLRWGQGLGIGAGGMLAGIRSVPLGSGPKKNLGRALEQLAINVSQGASQESLFITANFPKFAYKLAAEAGWVRSAKTNGLRWRDLSLRQ